MNSEVLKYVLLIGFSILGIIKNSITFNPIQFQCNNYILNNYLYIILSWGIVLTTVTTLKANDIKLHDLFTGPFTLLLAIGSIMLLIGLLFIPPQLFFTKHLLYIFEVILFGILIYPQYVNNKELFEQVGMSTLLILVALSGIIYMYPDIIKDSIGVYLLMGLLGLIVARFVEIFIAYRNKRIPSTYSRILSYITIALFSLFIMYDTKKLIKGARNCVNPDYINQSLNLFLDTLNMFTSLYRVSDN